MGANWNLPVATSLYIDVLSNLKSRDDDAVTLNFSVATNLPEHSIKFERNLNLFQEWISGVWVNKVLSIAGGGTGASNPNDIRLNLGLGTMALQHASSVAITGGTISGVIINDSTYNRGNILAMTEIQGTNIRAAGTFVGPGIYITQLNASELATGIAPTARLGSGVADATTYLRGDQTWSVLVVNPTRWTDVYYNDHIALPIDQINGMYIINANSPTVQNVHLPIPNDLGIANPHSPLRITTFYGTAQIYGGYPPGPYADIGGRPSPFVMDIPKMSIDLTPDPALNIWKVF